MTQKSAIGISAQKIATDADGQTKQWRQWKRRKKKTDQFENKELAEFLEETVHALVDLDPDSIAVIARNENSQTVFTNSFNCNAEYKAILAFHFLSDIVTDIVRINRDYIFNDDEDGMGDDEIE